MNDTPRIEITVDRASRCYLPEDDLIATFHVQGISPAEIQAIEASVLWYTEGTGEEDLSTHDFRRLLPIDSSDQDLTQRRQFQTHLPRSPLSYEGVIVKIRWAIRVRVFLQQGRDHYEEIPFRLGNLAPAEIAAPAEGQRSSKSSSDKSQNEKSPSDSKADDAA